MSKGRRVKPGNPKLAIGLIRMSTGTQELSPAAQAASMDRWANFNGVQITAIFFDYAVSGAAPVHERPGLIGALAALRDTGAGILLAAKRDRVARDVGIMSTVDSTVKASGAVLRTADGASDGSDDDEGAFVRKSVEDMVAVLERMKIKSRTRAALAVKKARGERTGQAPYGNRVSDDGIHLETDAVEQSTIASIAVLRSEGLSVRAIAAELATRGVVGRTGHALSHTQVHRIIAKAA